MELPNALLKQTFPNLPGNEGSVSLSDHLGCSLQLWSGGGMTAS